MNALGANLMAAYGGMANYAHATPPEEVPDGIQASSSVLSNTLAWNAYGDTLAKTPSQKNMEPWAHLGHVTKTVPNAGMLMHQGALPIGMRTALATPTVPDAVGRLFGLPLAITTPRLTEQGPRGS